VNQSAHKRHLHHSLGALSSYVKDGNKVTIETKDATAVVTVFSDEVIRVRIFRKGEERKDFSYAVISEPILTNIDVKEGEETIHISTQSVTLSIQKDPLRFSFLDHLGNVLNEDDPAFGTGWIGQEVTTYKRLQKGERFVGLGEKTGNLDRRGTAYTNWNTT
jgi:alpha-glucosidase